tara:strand:+ start:305 stop:490 length:186 start_codon:yes stop_codon:yes gene_type:complete
MSADTVEYGQEHKEYLDDLRESGVTNMFGAGSYLQDEFGITKYDANRILMTWMENFGKEDE